MRKSVLFLAFISQIGSISSQTYCETLGRSTKTDREWYSIEILSQNSSQVNIPASLVSRTDGDCYRGILNPEAPVAIIPGSTLQVTLNGSMNWTYVNLFADWNADGDFEDAGEHIGQLPTSNVFPNGPDAGSAYRTFKVTAPDNAKKGITRFRFFMAYGINGACQLVRTTDAAIAADFLAVIGSSTLDAPRKITVSSANPSTGTAVITGTEETEITTDASTVTVTASATTGYSFKHWTNKKDGSIVSTQNPYSYMDAQEIELVANFQDRYTQLTDLPTIFIETENGVGVTSKDDYVGAKVSIRSKDGKLDITQIGTEIKGRGNSTWGMAKKPYRLKFNSKIKFLGNKANAKSWVLLANYADKTLMRNALALETARNKMNFAFTPSVTFVDVVLNGVNMGSYLLTDQIEQDGDRVNIEKQALTVEASDPNIHGGYLIEVDGFADAELSWFKTSRQMKVTIKYPKDDEINPAQADYITNYTQSMENALFATDYTSATNGFRKYVDENSFADWYISCELFGNSDSFWSTYMYKKRTEVFKFGPIWDFDIAFNNDNRLNDATRKLMLTYAHENKLWITRFMSDPTLKEVVKARWVAMRNNGLKDFMLDYIDKTAIQLDRSQKNNYSVWKTLNSKVYLELAARGTYAAEVAFLKEYVTNRITYLDEVFEAPEGTGIYQELAAEQQQHIALAPNPTTADNVRVYIRLNKAASLSVRIVTLDGKIVSHQVLDAAEGDTYLDVSNTSLESGVYILAVQIGSNAVKYERLIIQ